MTEDDTFRRLRRGTIDQLRDTWHEVINSMDTTPADWEAFEWILHTYNRFMGEDYNILIREESDRARNWTIMLGMFTIFLEVNHWSVYEFLFELPDPKDDYSIDEYYEFRRFWFLLAELDSFPEYDDDTELWYWTKTAAELYFNTHGEYPPKLSLGTVILPDDNINCKRHYWDEQWLIWWRARLSNSYCVWCGS